MAQLAEAPNIHPALQGLELLTRDEVCAALRCSVPTVFRMVREGRLAEPLRIGRQNSWLASDIAAFLRGGN